MEAHVHWWPPCISLICLWHGGLLGTSPSPGSTGVKFTPHLALNLCVHPSSPEQLIACPVAKWLQFPTNFCSQNYCENSFRKENPWERKSLVQSPAHSRDLINVIFIFSFINAWCVCGILAQMYLNCTHVCLSTVRPFLNFYFLFWRTVQVRAYRSDLWFRASRRLSLPSFLCKQEEWPVPFTHKKQSRIPALLDRQPHWSHWQGFHCFSCVE